jgi:hypothetical protein
VLLLEGDGFEAGDETRRFWRVSAASTSSLDKVSALLALFRWPMPNVGFSIEDGDDGTWLVRIIMALLLSGSPGIVTPRSSGKYGGGVCSCPLLLASLVALDGSSLVQEQSLSECYEWMECNLNLRAIFHHDDGGDETKRKKKNLLDLFLLHFCCMKNENAKKLPEIWVSEVFMMALSKIHSWGSSASIGSLVSSDVSQPASQRRYVHYEQATPKYTS